MDIAPALRTSKRKLRVGRVVSNKMQKSIVVAIERRVPHGLYRKYFRRSEEHTSELQVTWPSRMPSSA